MNKIPSDKQCIAELNQKLQDHPGYEDGMQFRELGANGSVSFYHPKLDAFLNDKVDSNISFAPFEETIKVYVQNQRN